MSNVFICGQNLAYLLPNHQVLFTGLTFNLSRGEKIALIGENGVGKTSLFKLICGELKPSSGHFNRSAQLHYVPQRLTGRKGCVANVLIHAPLLQALQKVQAGDAQPEDFDLIGSDWNFYDRLMAELAEWGFKEDVLAKDFNSLSGGEKEKLLIAEAFLSRSDILLFDEPTNNLDNSARNLFYQKMRETDKGCLIISHDRELLGQMEIIWELSTSGLRCFGGNYEFYRQVCDNEKAAKESALVQAVKDKLRLQEQQRDLREKEAHRSRYAGKQKDNRRYTPMQVNQMKGYAEESLGVAKGRLSAKQAEKEEQAYQLGIELKEDIIKIPLPQKPFLKEKLLEIAGLNFGYGQALLLHGFNLLMKGGERIALIGKNGCGKTTLIRLITGELKLQAGICHLNGRAVYLNQNLELLNPELTLLDNVLALNQGLKVNEAYALLANFKFRNELALKKASCLSGGELLRACLAAVLGTRQQPDLIILDEPTNNLDIQSLEVLEAALCQYHGALLVVSHDRFFLEAIAIEREVEVGNQLV